MVAARRCDQYHCIVTDAPLTGRVIIAGGSGFLGTSLAHHLTARGASVVVLSRGAPKVAGAWRHVSWDARSPGDWKRELDGAAGVVNLVGRSVDCVKTPDHQDEILRSRVEATNVLGEAMRAVEKPPPVWVQMSTAHIYGDPPSVVCSEESAFGCGFAPFIGKAWEKAFEESARPGQRKVILRTSFVIGRDRGAGGGALALCTGDIGNTCSRTWVTDLPADVHAILRLHRPRAERAGDAAANDRRCLCFFDRSDRCAGHSSTRPTRRLRELVLRPHPRRGTPRQS